MADGRLRCDGCGLAATWRRLWLDPWLSVTPSGKLYCPGCEDRAFADDVEITLIGARTPDGPLWGAVLEIDGP